MKQVLTLLMLAVSFEVTAHVGSPNVFFQGNAGEYFVRVTIRPPDVVPGVADIVIRVNGGSSRKVTLLPAYGKVGRSGAPPAEEALLVRGQTNVYSGVLWLMKSGAYSVEVNIEGTNGKGSVVIPLNSVATNTRPMTVSFQWMLIILGVILVASALKIGQATLGESILQPEAIPTNKDRWRGRLAVAFTGMFLTSLLLGGKIWWDVADRNYRNNVLYNPTPCSARVNVERGQNLLTITSQGQNRPLLPDHGKIMHAFAIQDAGPHAFVHFHPIHRSEAEFEAPLPPIPAGRYKIYADVTYEDAFSETLTAIVEIPPTSEEMTRLWMGNATEPICSIATAKMLSTNLVFPPDPDDSWYLGAVAAAPTPKRMRDSQGFAVHALVLDSDHKIIWDNPAALTLDSEVSLRFKLVGPDGRFPSIEPYMGMTGHAVIWRLDGKVFTHVHPQGTFSMASQQFFMRKQSQQPLLPTTQFDSFANRTNHSFRDHNAHTNQPGIEPGLLSFIYAFPEPGAYRIWVQTKSQGRIFTESFEATVARKD